MKNNRMKITAAVLAALLLLAALCACGDGRIRKNEAKYVDSIRFQAEKYFSDLSRGACGVEPGKTELSLTAYSGDETECEDLDALLHGTSPILRAGLTGNANGAQYTEVRIRELVTAAYRAGITVDLYFNNDDTVIYRIRPEGVKTDRATGADGGRMRVTEDYPIDPLPEESGAAETEKK